MIHVGVRREKQDRPGLGTLEPEKREATSLRDSRVATFDLMQRRGPKKSERAPIGTDIFSTARRSQIMSLIRGRDTKPELLVRKILRSLGYRFKKNVSNLAGTPDIVLTREKVVIFVHGCFWHGHRGCAKGRTLPKTRRQFWQSKIQQNIARDRWAIRKLRRAGWRVLKVWECRLKRPNEFSIHLGRFIEGKESNELQKQLPTG
jgi:DNA mismatch endonuclease (patch repair protein)